MKVAVVHYWFITRRGGEKVVESILKLYPDADIYTLFYDKNQYGNYLSNHKIYTSILNIPFLRRYYQKVFPLYPIAMRSLKLKQHYDLIISSESGPAKGIRIKNNTPHICYIHSPMRYAWSHSKIYIKSANRLLEPLLRFFFRRLRHWDKTTIDNVDLYIANSLNVANRVKNFYNRSAEIIHPPIEEKLFSNALTCHSKAFYLSFGAITPYKRIDLLIEVFNQNKKPLVIIGEGSEKEKLVKKAKNNIQFKSCKEWSQVAYYLLRSKALLFPGEEDFGMIPLEVMAYGVPVLAYAKGGALETVVENRSNIAESSGLFFSEQKTNSIQKVVEDFEKIQNQFDKNWIRKHAKKFQESIFLQNFQSTVSKFLDDEKKTR